MVGLEYFYLGKSCAFLGGCEFLCCYFIACAVLLVVVFSSQSVTLLHVVFWLGFLQ